MTKSEYDELKYLIDEYDKSDEGNDALVVMVFNIRKWLEKYEDKHKKVIGKKGLAYKSSEGMYNKK